MKNKIKTLGTILAIGGGLALAENDGGEFPFPVKVIDTNRVEFIEGPIFDELNKDEVRFVAEFKAGDTNHYTLQSCTNLLEGAWVDSTVNTNVYNELLDFGITNLNNNNVGIYEPITSSEKKFYRLRSN